MTNTKGTMVAETDIAVIGMAGRFPGARDLAEYWNNLRDGVESLTQLTDQQLEASGIDPALLRDPEYVKAAFLVPEMDMFDARVLRVQPAGCVDHGSAAAAFHRVLLERARACRPRAARRSTAPSACTPDAAPACT